MQEQVADDQSHYEISLTAGQAFVAFVLLLLSLAASFAFGLIIGKGQGDERLVVRETPSVITEASVLPRKPAGRIVELGVTPEATEPAAQQPVVNEETTTPPPDIAPATEAAATVVASAPAIEPAPAPAPVPSSAPAVPHYAQILSTGDQKSAEGLAAKLIDRGFNAAYVERGTTEKGPVFRVRVRFASEPEARAAEPKLREFSKDIWITKAQ